MDYLQGLMDKRSQAFKDKTGARMLRLAVVNNAWQHGELTDADAKELLSGALTPGDTTSIVDDSALLGDPHGITKIKEGAKPND